MADDTPKLLCPSCGGEHPIVALVQSFDANTMAHYCFSFKPQDDDAPASCHDCDWRGKRKDLVLEATNG